MIESGERLFDSVVEVSEVVPDERRFVADRENLRQVLEDQPTS